MALSDWLQAKGCTHVAMESTPTAAANWSSRRCTHVAMESTGVYWKPIYHLLEGRGFTLLVVNAQPIQAVPGRKTDVKDAEWIADLLRHGLCGAASSRSGPSGKGGSWCGTAKPSSGSGREINRIHKTLEGANIKLAAVASDVLGQSGRAMLEAMVQGTDDPHEPAQPGDRGPDAPF